MKLKSGHIIGVILVAIGAFMVFAVTRSHTPRLAPEEIAPSVPVHGSSSGSLPPVGTNPDAVAVIETETADFDMGTIPNDRETTSQLKVFNRGKAPLHIIDIRSSCACTRGTIAENRATIPAGGDSFIDVTVFPERVPGFFSQKTLSILSNDAMHPTIEVKVKAHIDPEFDLIPESLDFGEIKKGETVQRTVLLRQRASYPVELGEIKYMEEEGQKSPDFRFAFQKLPENEWAEAGKTEYRITVTLEAFLPPGEFVRRMKLGTSIKRYPWAPYEIKGVVKAPYEVTPAYPVPAVIRENGGRLSGKVQIAAAARPGILEISSDPDVLKVEIQPGNRPGDTLLSITQAADVPPGKIAATLWYEVKIGDQLFQERTVVKGLLMSNAAAAAVSAPPTP